MEDKELFLVTLPNSNIVSVDYNPDATLEDILIPICEKNELHLSDYHIVDSENVFINGDLKVGLLFDKCVTLKEKELSVSSTKKPFPIIKKTARFGARTLPTTSSSDELGNDSHESISQSTTVDDIMKDLINSSTETIMNDSQEEKTNASKFEWRRSKHGEQQPTIGNKFSTNLGSRGNFINSNNEKRSLRSPGFGRSVTDTENPSSTAQSGGKRLNLLSSSRREMTTPSTGSMTSRPPLNRSFTVDAKEDSSQSKEPSTSTSGKKKPPKRAKRSNNENRLSMPVVPSSSSSSSNSSSSLPSQANKPTTHLTSTPNTRGTLDDSPRNVQMTPIELRQRKRQISQIGPGANVLRRLRDNDVHLKILNFSADYNSNVLSSPDTIQVLFSLLRNNVVVTTLNLSGTIIGTEGAVALARCLGENVSITDLDVSYNKFDIEGMFALAAAISSNQSLKRLSIEGNRLKEGGDAIALALTKNTSLKWLNIRNCGLSRGIWEQQFIYNSTLLSIESDKENDIIFTKGGKIGRMADTNRIINDSYSKVYLSSSSTTMMMNANNNSSVPQSSDTKLFLQTQFSNTIISASPAIVFDCVINRHIAALYEICRYGVKISEIDENESLLRSAVENWDHQMIKFLVSQGCQPTDAIIQKASEIDKALADILRQLFNTVDLSDGSLRWSIEDNWSKSVTSLDLSNNQLEKIPAEILKKISSLPKLANIDLSKNRLVELPPQLGQLTQLKSLVLTDNKIETLPSSFVDLKQLKLLELKGNPIGLLPDDIQRKDVNKVLTYLNEMQEPNKQWNRIKLIVVGPENVGKTHLVNCLRKRDYPKNISTDGIDVEPLSLNKRFKYLVYDFGGQEVFYPTHQFFLCDRAIYIVVFDISNMDKWRTEYWLRKLKLLGRNLVPPPVIMVGTHLDDKRCTPQHVNNVATQCKKLKASFSNILGIVFVSCPAQQGIKELKHMLNNVAMKQKMLTTLVPQSYIVMDRMLNQERSKKKMLTWDEYKELAVKVHVTNSKNLQVMTEFLHDAGSLIWFDKPVLRDVVILDDKWLADVMSSIVSFKSSWKDGIIHHQTLEIAWKAFPPSLHRTLLELLMKFEVVYPKRGDPTASIVPSLLPINPNQEFLKFPSVKEFIKHEIIERTYKMEFLPIGFFPRLVARIYQVPELVCHNAYRNGFMLSPSSALADCDPFDEVKREEILSKVIDLGYPQGRVSFKMESESTMLQISICRPRKISKACDNIFLLSLLVCENLIQESYKQFEETIVKTCTIKRGKRRGDFLFDDLVKMIQTGVPFIENPFKKKERSEKRSTDSDDALRKNNSFNSLTVNTGSASQKTFGFDTLPSTPMSKSDSFRFSTFSPSTPPSPTSSSPSLSSSPVSTFNALQIEDENLSTDNSEHSETSKTEDQTPPTRRTLTKIKTEREAKRKKKTDKSSYLSISQLAPDISFDSIPIIDNDNIHILYELGRGGCGIVYKAEWIEQTVVPVKSQFLDDNTGPEFPPTVTITKIPVAVKELFLDPSSANGQPSSPLFREFHHEVFMMSGLKCPYLVELLGIQTYPLRMVLEFVPGQNLSDILHDSEVTDHSFTWPLRRKIALDIARGMAYLHTKVVPPIIHRDLRSPNCFVLSTDIDNAPHGVHCKVADFGLAQKMYTNAAAERLFTWQWLAPEVLDEDMSYDERADVFSYGVVLWELATRLFPYDEFDEHKSKREIKLRPDQLSDENVMRELDEGGWVVNHETGDACLLQFNKHKIVRLIINDDLRPSILPTVPMDFATLIKKCWTKDAAARPTFPEIEDLLTSSLPQSLQAPVPEMKKENKFHFSSGHKIKVDHHHQHLQHHQHTTDSPFYNMNNRTEPIFTIEQFQKFLNPNITSQQTTNSDSNAQIEDPLLEKFTQLPKIPELPQLPPHVLANEGEESSESTEDDDDDDDDEDEALDNKQVSNKDVSSVLSPRQSGLDGKITFMLLYSHPIGEELLKDKEIGDRNPLRSSSPSNPIVPTGSSTSNKSSALSTMVLVNKQSSESSSSSTTTTTHDNHHGTNVWLGCKDGTVLVLDDSDGKVHSQISVHKGQVTTLAVVGGSKVWSGSRDHTITVCCANKMKLEERHLLAHTAPIFSIISFVNFGINIAWSIDERGVVLVWKDGLVVKKLPTLKNPKFACLVNLYNKSISLVTNYMDDVSVNSNSSANNNNSNNNNNTPLYTSSVYQFWVGSNECIYVYNVNNFEMIKDINVKKILSNLSSISFDENNNMNSVCNLVSMHSIGKYVWVQINAERNEDNTNYNIIVVFDSENFNVVKEIYEDILHVGEILLSKTSPSPSNRFVLGFGQNKAFIFDPTGVLKYTLHKDKIGNITSLLFTDKEDEILSIVNQKAVYKWKVNITV
eukprot:TRINITY_DN496_c3_g1_i1.p1 TRINITY_DN496_c3_g1~~TRINITY_DN496_c3_g1_i1.p1  ORF type:complete len:2368 (-),score=568.15 TRINITY_DN496_c3_g1_i1:56-7159(-)